MVEPSTANLYTTNYQISPPPQQYQYQPQGYQKHQNTSKNYTVNPYAFGQLPQVYNGIPAAPFPYGLYGAHQTPNPIHPNSSPPGLNISAPFVVRFPQEMSSYNPHVQLPHQQQHLFNQISSPITGTVEIGPQVRSTQLTEEKQRTPMHQQQYMTEGYLQPSDLAWQGMGVEDSANFSRIGGTAGVDACRIYPQHQHNTIGSQKGKGERGRCQRGQADKPSSIWKLATYETSLLDEVLIATAQDIGLNQTEHAALKMDMFRNYIRSYKSLRDAIEHGKLQQIVHPMLAEFIAKNVMEVEVMLESEGRILNQVPSQLR